MWAMGSAATMLAATASIRSTAEETEAALELCRAATVKAEAKQKDLTKKQQDALIYTCPRQSQCASPGRRRGKSTTVGRIPTRIREAFKAAN